MKVKCSDCGKLKDGLPKDYNKFSRDLCYDCYGNLVLEAKNKEERRIYMKAYRQLHAEELKAKKKAYNRKYKEKRHEEQQNPEFYKKKAKEAEKNIKKVLDEHNLSHLKPAMILDGEVLDRELRKRHLEASP